MKIFILFWALILLASSGITFAGNANDEIFSSDFESAAIITTTKVGGSIIGLSSNGLKLALNNVEVLTVPTNSPNFMFAADIKVGDPWSVTISEQPEGEENCSVANNTGIMPAEGVNNVIVNCLPAEESMFNPRMVGAASTSNTTVIVTFNKAMGQGADDPKSYIITLESVNPEASSLTVVAARFTDPLDRTVVELETLSQSQVTYRVTAINVRDLFGNHLPAPEFPSGSTSLADPASATFPGTGATATGLVDSDGDGLTDAEEQLGWLVTIKRSNGTMVERMVAPDPFVADTDGDGLSDFVEAAIASDPRDGDTDDDRLPDRQEFNDIFSGVTSQDSDGDGLSDYGEFYFFKTSPILADTDGDQFSDAQEIFEANRDPRSADLPRHDIVVGDVSVSMEVTFAGETVDGTRDTSKETRDVSLRQSNERELSTADTTTTEWFANAGIKAQAGVGFPDGFSASVEFTAEAGVGASGTYVQSEASKRGSKQAHSDSLLSDAEKFSGQTTTRTVTGASLVVPLVIENAGDISFTISDVEVTALVPDPVNPTVFVPIGTLLPPADGVSSFTLGTIDSRVGPFKFQTRAGDINPDLIDSLLANPRGIIVQVSNFKLTDESDQNFAFQQQDITERTASVVIDFGNGEVERYWAAIGTGRTIDSNADGVIDGNDRRVIFDDRGKPVGVSLLEILSDIVGLRRIDLDTETDLPVNDEEGRLSSYTTITSVDGVVSIGRIRDFEADLDVRRAWILLASQGFDAGRSMGDVTLSRGKGVTLVFTQDSDSDLVARRIEFVYGCLDTDADTDDDGLTDYQEIYNSHIVKVEDELPLEVFSSCAFADTDGDGLSDADERTRVSDDGTGPTDPSNVDTDGDGSCDGDGVAGCRVDDFPLDPNRDQDRGQAGQAPLLAEYLFTNASNLDTSGNGRDAEFRGNFSIDNGGGCAFFDPDRFNQARAAVFFNFRDDRSSGGCGLDTYAVGVLPNPGLSQSFSISYWLASFPDVAFRQRTPSTTIPSTEWFTAGSREFTIPYPDDPTQSLRLPDFSGNEGPAGARLYEEWDHYVIVVDGSSGTETVASFFVNGEQVDRVIKPVIYTNPRPTEQILIGYDSFDIGGEDEPTYIDDIRFFGGPLSPITVRELFQEKSGSP